MKTCRFFVSNLPINSTEKDLEEAFKKYGRIENIELKIKQNLVDANDKKVIGFVTLKIEPNKAQNCINDLQCYVLHGQKISVVLARESFLQRLEKERQIAQTIKNDYANTVGLTQSKPETQNNTAPENKRKKFNVHDDLQGDFTLWSNEQLHVIKNEETRKQQLLNNIGLTADEKRRESIRKMKLNCKQRKNLIQEALKNSNQFANSKKLIFSDEECGEHSNSQDPCSTNSRVTKTQLFSDDDSNEFIENSTKPSDLKLQSILYGRKGSQLAKLQSKQSLDARFRLNEKFLDSDDDDCDNGVNVSGNENCTTTSSDERKLQINVLGKVVERVSLKNNPIMHKEMVRYDPNNEKHQKTTKRKDQNHADNKANNKQKMLEKVITQENNDHQVSKDVYYKVTDSLQQLLKTPSEGFSLSSMFSNAQYLEKREEQLKNLSNKKVLLHSNNLKKSLTRNSFGYDSSCTESEVECNFDNIEVSHKNNNASGKPGSEIKNRMTKSKLQILQESFFITANDKRLKEGVNFFRIDKTPKIENYEEIRQRLKQIIKTKISKTKKSFINAGYKVKKRKQKY